MGFTKLSDIRAFDAHLVQQNNRLLESVRSVKDWAQTAPATTLPGICRWCHGKLKALMDGDPVDYCERGCEKNTSHGTYVGHCVDCGRQFQTGLKATSALRCFDCEELQAERDQSQADLGRLRYEFKRYGRGRWR